MCICSFFNQVMTQIIVVPPTPRYQQFHKEKVNMMMKSLLKVTKVLKYEIAINLQN